MNVKGNNLKLDEEKIYRVMEYLTPDCKTVQGYACLESEEFEKWKKHPHNGQVKAFAIISGMESMAEWGMISCKRLWDYEAKTNTLPKGMEFDEWEETFEYCFETESDEDDEEEFIRESLENLERLCSLCEIYDNSSDEDL